MVRSNHGPGARRGPRENRAAGSALQHTAVRGPGARRGPRENRAAGSALQHTAVRGQFATRQPQHRSSQDGAVQHAGVQPGRRGAAHRAAADGKKACHGERACARAHAHSWHNWNSLDVLHVLHALQHPAVRGHFSTPQQCTRTPAWSHLHACARTHTHYWHNWSDAMIDCRRVNRLRTGWCCCLCFCCQSDRDCRRVERPRTGVDAVTAVYAPAAALSRHSLALLFACFTCMHACCIVQSGLSLSLSLSLSAETLKITLLFSASPFLYATAQCI
jgi:hypothetical protein